MTKQDNSPFDRYQPQQSYIPGGGSGAAPVGGDPPAPPSAPEGEASGQRRPLGSLGRRLQQRSSASVPPDGSSDMDDEYPPQRTPRSRPPREDYEPRGGYGAPDDRGRRPSRPSTGGRRRGRSYDDDYSRSDDRTPNDYDDDPPDEAPGWGDERGSRARSRGERRARPDDESEEMIARRGRPRSGPAHRRGAPDQEIPPWDGRANPLDDPRAPPELRGPSRGGSSRRPGPPPGASRGGRPSDYDGGQRRGSDRYGPPGYTDEGPAAPFDDGVADGYSEEYEARPRRSDDRGAPAGGRGSRATPSRSGRGGYGGPDEYGPPGGRGRGPARPAHDPYDAGGYGASYEEPSGYTDFGAAYPPARGGQMGLAPRDAFEESSAWAPGGGLAGGRGASASKPPAKRKNGVLGIASRLLSVVVFVVALVVFAGPKVAPMLGRYLPFLGGSAQPTPPAFATYTPGPTPTNPPNYRLFSSPTKGYAMAYPSSWGTATVSGEGSQADSVDKFTQGSGPAVMTLERAPAFDSATDIQLIQAEVQGAQAQGATLTEITTAATTVGVGGEVWQRHEYKVTTKNGAKLHIAVLASHHLGKGYVIALISSDTAFAKDDMATFEPMLRTFRFI
ncbi:MAG TPA: hypothetical protein VFQ25_03960 [Ktedonobacterales bacterium]|nr:hypothetical protein [Ktedonobacterales bacterium]